MGDIRIIGGALRRRKLHVVDRPDLRPSPSRVRETLFNWLGQDLDGWVVLDLFSGSGALGFEAASRGARRVVMVDRDPVVLQTLQKAREALALAGVVEVVAGDARSGRFAVGREFDLVMADPPFQHADVESFMKPLHSVVRASGFLYLETPYAVQETPEWRLYRQGKAGQVHYQLFTPHSIED